MKNKENRRIKIEVQETSEIRKIRQRKVLKQKRCRKQEYERKEMKATAEKYQKISEFS